MELNKETLKKIIEISRYYYKDNDVLEHSQQAYETALKREKILKNDREDMQIELLALCLTACYKNNITIGGYFTTLPQLTGISKAQLATLAFEFEDLDKLQEINFYGNKIIDENVKSEYDIFHDLREDLNESNSVIDENINIKINISNGEIDTSIRQEEANNNFDGYYRNENCIFDANLISGIFRSSNIDDMVKGNFTLSQNDNEIDNTPIHTRFRRIFNNINRLENEMRNAATVDEKKEFAAEKLELYSALDERSKNRSWLKAILHPISTYKEWSLKKELATQMKEQYNLTDENLQDLSYRCNNGVGDFLYLDENGTHLEPPYVEPEKVLTEYDKKVDSFIKGLTTYPSLDKEQLGKETSFNQEISTSSQVKGKEKSAINNEINID